VLPVPKHLLKIGELLGRDGDDVGIDVKMNAEANEFCTSVDKMAWSGTR
jgi:hypothetical protein